MNEEYIDGKLDNKDDKGRLKMDFNKLLAGLLAITFILMIFNQFQLVALNSGDMGGLATGAVVVEASEIIPKGVPRVYGNELGVAYDDVSPNDPGLADKTISTLGNLDRQINLEGQNLERYTSIVSQISCEYCCGANSIVFSKKDAEERERLINEAIAKGELTKEKAEEYKIIPGAAACGCAHSYAMRGLAKYLIKEHGTEFTDEEILEELAKWKTLFFPDQMSSKAKIMKEKGIPFSYASLGSNEYRGIEQGSSGSGGGMVGGC